jgi:hypothetical protein
MRKFLLFFMVLLLITAAHGKKIAQLVELSRPQLMEVENDKLFVTEGVNIYIYSLKNFSLIKKFGKDGEGPREFKINPFGGKKLGTGKNFGPPPSWPSRGFSCPFY